MKIFIFATIGYEDLYITLKLIGVRNRYLIILLLLLTSLSVFAQKIEIGSCVTSDGGSYHGQMFRGKPNGKGKTVYKNKDVYEGEYMKGLRHGEGTYIFADGEKYVGQWFRISNMEWEPFIFRMETDMKACGIKIINKVKAPCFITMETSISVIGNMINAVELVSISSQMEPHTMVCGQMI